MAGGLWGGNTSQYDLQDDGRMTKPSGQSKPPFRIPSMAEINAIPWNGMTVVSTFSGTGGSCLGYRMAGFKVAWANEFVPEAQRSYKANAAPDSSRPETNCDDSDASITTSPPGRRRWPCSS